MSRTFATLFRAVILGLLLGAAPAHAQRELLVGGASLTGVYYQVAQALCDLLNRHGGGKYQCVGHPALGSVFNLRAVERGLFDFAVAQSDRNWQAASGVGDWQGRPAAKVRSVFSMHAETVLLVARQDAGVRAVADLAGKRVNIGNPGSGQRGNAEDVLRLYALDPQQDLKAVGLQQADAARALVDGKIDAFFYTVGNPSAAISTPALATAVRIVPIDSAALRSFVAERSYYVMATIPAGSYAGVGRPVQTYAVKATVVTHAGLEDEVVHDLVKTVFERLDDLRRASPAFQYLEPGNMLEGLSAPLHPGALRYYREQGWRE